MTISSGSSIPFAVCSASTVVPKRWAIDASVSPSTTVYVCGCGAGGGVGTGVGTAVAAGVAVGAGVADGALDGLIVGEGLGRGVCVGEGVGTSEGEGAGVAVESASWMRPSITAEASATPPSPTPSATTPTATSGPRGARRARPAIPRQAGSGASSNRVLTRPSPRPVLPLPRPARAR